MKDLPPFRTRHHGDVVAYISEILISENSTEDSCFIDLLDYEDGHYRVLFNPSYFILPQGQAEPTKSQWNSLKKKMKRRDSTVFVFKIYGKVGTKDRQYYLDFGFLPDLS
jgi:hypothetical protein